MAYFFEIIIVNYTHGVYQYTVLFLERIQQNCIDYKGYNIHRLRGYWSVP